MPQNVAYDQGLQSFVTEFFIDTCTRFYDKRDDFNFLIITFPFFSKCKNILRDLRTKFMLEHVANIKTLLKEGSCPPVYCCHRVIADRSLCQQLRSSVTDIMTSLIPTMWPF